MKTNDWGREDETTEGSGGITSNEGSRGADRGLGLRQQGWTEGGSRRLPQRRRAGA